LAVVGERLKAADARTVSGPANDMKGGNSSKENSPQTRHRAKQIEEEKQVKPRVTEDRWFVANSIFSVVLFP
jgi:hypothetical protein